MNIALIAALALVGATLAGFVVMIKGLKSAPEGFQNESGFQFGAEQAPVEVVHQEAA